MLQRMVVVRRRRRGMGGGSERWYAASLQDAGIVFVWSPGAMPQAGMELRRWRAGRERGGVRASAEPRIFGLVGRGAGTRTPCARESCDCSQQSRACGWLVRRGRFGRARVRSLACPGLFGGGLWGETCWQAHSVRGESCNSDSSPEPSAACSEGGVWGSVLLLLEPGVPRVARGTPGYSPVVPTGRGC
jgi:hypothetical protein